MVENCTIDLFMDGSRHAAKPQEPVEDDWQDQDPEGNKATASVALENMAAQSTRRDEVIAKKRVWNVPREVPRFYNIPIAVTSLFAEAEKGKFMRLGMDAAVNGVWLAYYWALLDQNDEVIRQSEELIFELVFRFPGRLAGPQCE